MLVQYETEAGASGLQVDVAGETKLRQQVRHALVDHRFLRLIHYDMVHVCEIVIAYH